MKKKSTFKTNIIYGVLAIVPVAVIFLLLIKVVEILDKITEPLGLESYLGASLAIVIGILLMLIVCYVIGALVRTGVGSWTFERLEKSLLEKVPGYPIISSALKGFAADQTAYPSALVDLFGSGASVLCFVMEENDNGSMTIFVPSSPAITVGTVYIVDRSRVSILDAAARDLADCISQWGVGSRRVVGSQPLIKPDIQGAKG